MAFTPDPSKQVYGTWTFGYTETGQATMVQSTDGTPPPSGYVPPIPTGLISLGDSRIQTTGGIPAGTSLYETLGVGTGFAAGIYSAIDNVVRGYIGYNFGVTSSTHRAMYFRASSPKRRSVSGSPTGGVDDNPAYLDTGNSADRSWNGSSIGDYSPLTHPANQIFFLGLTNAFGGNPTSGYYATRASPPNETKGIMVVAAEVFDVFAPPANKVIWIGETPRGQSTVHMETRAVAAGAFTATNVTNFQAADQWDNPAAAVITAANQVLTRVASAPGPGQFSEAGGTYTVDAALNGTNVYITYAWGAVETAASALSRKIVNEWMQSNAPNFVGSNAFDYGMPGARFNRPWVQYVDIWGALTRPGTNYARPGTLWDGVHGTHMGVTLAAAAFATAFRALYPALTTSLLVPPTQNNQRMVAGTAALRFTSAGIGGGIALAPSSFNTASPPAASAMRIVACNALGVGPSIFTLTDQGTFFRITGPGIDTALDGTENRITKATGAWSINFTSSLASSGLYFEKDFNNLLGNTMFQYDQGAGAGSGLWGTAPLGWTMACGDTALGTTLTVSIGEAVHPVSGRNALRIRVNGLAGTGGGITITSSHNRFVASAVPANNKSYQIQADVLVKPGTNGHLYGLYTATATWSQTVTGGYAVGEFAAVTGIGGESQSGATAHPMTNGDIGVDGAWHARALLPPVLVAAPMVLGAITSRGGSIGWQASKPVSCEIWIDGVAFRELA